MAAAATLCCILNCPESGSPGQPAAFKISPLVVIALRPALVQPQMLEPFALLRFKSTQFHSQDSKPSYIRHLALLI
jgi:hypothetical protein